MVELTYTADSSYKIRPASVRPGDQAGGPGAGRGAGDRGRGRLRLRLFDHRALSGIHRRRLCQSRFHPHFAQGLRLSRARCWSATMRRSRPGRSWRGSTTAILRTALNQAHADVAGSEAAVKNLDAQIALQQPLIEQETADIAAAEANLQFAQEEQTRYDGLMKSGSGTVQRAQQSDAALREKAAQLQHGKSGLIAAQKQDRCSHHRARQGGGATGSRPRGRAAGGAEPVLHRDIGAGRRHRRRPHAAGRSIRAGRHPIDGGGSARRGLCSRELQGNPTHPCAQRPAGRSADRQFSRHQTEGPCRQPVAGLGLEFALLPPDNATGNFTKIVQRVPVKIVLDDHSLTGLLRPGMSAEPTVNTKADAVAERESTSRVALAPSRPNGG